MKRKAAAKQQRTMTGQVATIDEYLARIRPEQRAALERLRKNILAAAPGAVECISYGMPAFRLDGRVLVYFAAATKHCALYPGAVLAGHADLLKGYDTSKGTVRFQPEKPLPATLVKTIVKARIAENARDAARKRKKAK